MNFILKKATAARKNYGSARLTSHITWLVFHYTANDGDTDESNAAYFQQRIVEASAHYFVDDDSVTQSVPDDHIAFTVGGSKWPDCTSTGGGAYYGRCTNANSISIEMCDTVENGVHDFSAATLRNAQELAAKLIVEYDIDWDHIICHFDVNGKHCPGVTGWIGSDRSVWQKFKKGLLAMTGEQIWAALTEYFSTQALPTTWDAAGQLQEAVNLGITDGKNPMLPTPRYQVAIMVKSGVKAALKKYGLV